MQTISLGGRGGSWFVVLGALILTQSQSIHAEDAFGQKTTGDVLAFGDSITYGVGDGANPGDFVVVIDDAGQPRGYPLRLSSTLGTGVINAGIPGEALITAGASRFPEVLIGAGVSSVIIMEGSNDAIQRADGGDYRIALQRVINVARAEGKKLVLATLPPPTGDRASLLPFTNLYSNVVRDLAIVNAVTLADVEQKFISVCPILEECSLYNLPEGLHPNTLGYSAIAEVMQAALAGN